MQLEVKCSKSYFKISLSQEAGTSGNNVEKELQKPRPKLKKYRYQIITENNCCTCNPMKMVVFCKHVLSL